MPAPAVRTHDAHRRCVIDRIHRRRRVVDDARGRVVVVDGRRRGDEHRRAEGDAEAHMPMGDRRAAHRREQGPRENNDFQPFAHVLRPCPGITPEAPFRLAWIAGYTPRFSSWVTDCYRDRREPATKKAPRGAFFEAGEPELSG